MCHLKLLYWRQSGSGRVTMLLRLQPHSRRCLLPLSSCACMCNVLSAQPSVADSIPTASPCSPMNCALGRCYYIQNLRAPKEPPPVIKQFTTILQALQHNKKNEDSRAQHKKPTGTSNRQPQAAFTSHPVPDWGCAACWKSTADDNPANSTPPCRPQHRQAMRVPHVHKHHTGRHHHINSSRPAAPQTYPLFRGVVVQGPLNSPPRPRHNQGTLQL